MSVTKTVTKEGKREDRKRQSGSIQKLGLRWVNEFSVSRTQIRQSEEREVTHLYTLVSPKNHDLGVM